MKLNKIMYWGNPIKSELLLCTPPTHDYMLSCFEKHLQCLTITQRNRSERFP